MPSLFPFDFSGAENKARAKLKTRISSQCNFGNRQRCMINLIAKAHLLKTDLETGKIGSIKQFAEVQNMDHGDAKNLIPLSYLAPSIIEDILAGQQPVDLSASRLKEVTRHLPISWSDQSAHPGFTA